MKNRTKLLLLFLFIIGSLVAVWVHLSLPTVIEVRSFESMEAVQKLITKELNSFPGIDKPLDIKYLKTTTQRVVIKTKWQSEDYAISDFSLALQQRLADYEFNVHGRVNLMDNIWNLHVTHQNTILYTIQIAANGTK